MAPISVNGRHDDRLAVLGHGHQAVGHGLVEAARTVDGDDGDDARAVRHLLERDMPRAIAIMPDPVERAPRADRRAVIDPVGVDQVGTVGIEMTRVRRQLDRRADLVADQVNDVEVLRQPDEVAVVAIIAGAAAALAVMDVGRTGDQAEVDVIVSQSDATRRVARRERERRRRGG